MNRFVAAAKARVPRTHRHAFRMAQHLLRTARPEFRAVLRRVELRSLSPLLSAYLPLPDDGRRWIDVAVRHVADPLRLRAGTSDLDVFRQVILLGQYDIPGLTDLDYIVDAGANIGLTSAVLLTRFPKARAIAIEPDVQNVALAKYNLRNFIDRCHVVHGALWSHDGAVGVRRGTFRDGRDWSVETVSETTDGGEVAPSYRMDTLLERFGFPRIDLLKIDIEGAELSVFRDGDTEFLGRTACCAIECHDSECRSAFLNAITRHDFATIDAGELLIAWRNAARGDPL